jgi:glutamine synthetase
VPTVNGYARYQPNMMAPQRAIWGLGSRGAAMRVVSSGKRNDAATRIENRTGEPAANPYLYIASQVHAGLDGIDRALSAPTAECASYRNDSDDALPASLSASLDALNAKESDALRLGFGEDFIHYFTHLKRHEITRCETALTGAQERGEWEQREYFWLY